MQTTTILSGTTQNQHFWTKQKTLRLRRSYSLALVMALLTCTTGRGDVSMEKIGDPMWQVGGTTISAAPGIIPRQDIGLLRTNLRERNVAMLGASHALAENPLAHLPLPGDPHDGPYDREWREALAAAGEINTDAFMWDQARLPNGVIFDFTLLPAEGAPMGASPDASQGPIIPNEVLPIELGQWRRFRNGSFDGSGNFDAVMLEPLDAVGQFTDENGNSQDFTGLSWSHAHRNWTLVWTADKQRERILGEWEYTVQLRDANGDGWDLTYGYTAVTEPTDLFGDFSYNDELDLRDLNILTQNVAVGATNLALDMNGDETVNVADIHYWVTDLKATWIGDANLDGEFNSGDLVDLFQAGKFETDQMARWNEGDWNGDERFGTDDLIVAFQGGGFEAGPRVSVATVPEPSSWVLLAFGLCSFVYRRNKR